MAWKCDVCDSYNEDSLTVCYVCGQARSEGSIREEKERLREAEKERLREEKERIREEKERIKEAEKDVREEKIRIRTEKSILRLDKLTENAERIGKILYVGSAGVAALMILLLLAGKVLGGDLDDVFTAAGAAISRGWDNVARTVLVGVTNVVQRVNSGPLQQLPQSVESMLAAAEVSMWDLTQAVEALTEIIFG